MARKSRGRSVGPFAVPDYGRGAYAVALAVRCLTHNLGHHDQRVTWSPGHELKLASGKSLEADFILWYQRTMMFGTDHPTEIVFGEVKSFGRDPSKSEVKHERKASKADVFGDEDVGRMKLLAQAFPGAILVFATMRDAAQITKGEVGRLRKLANWGREFVPTGRHTRGPVVLLTGAELFSSYSLREAWIKRGGRHKEMVDPGYVDLGHLKTLADLTQQLYLGMPAYHKWIEAKWKRRQAQMEERKKRAGREDQKRPSGQH